MRHPLLSAKVLLGALLVSTPLVHPGCSGSPPAALEFRIAEEEPGDGLEAFVLQGSDKTFYLHSEAPITLGDVAAVRAISQRGRPAIDLRFTESGRAKFLRLTEANVGKQCGMVVYGQLLSAPIIRAPIAEGRALIVGDFTLQEVQEIVSKLQLILPREG
jgi:preprotein translocase subunit SecD